MSANPEEESNLPNNIKWHCEEGDIYYSLEDLPDDFFEVHGGEIKSGETLLKVSYSSDNGGGGRAHTDPYTLAIPNGAKIDLEQRTPSNVNRRSLVQNEGTSTLLVIRVIDAKGAAPTLSAKELSDDIFGTHEDPYNLVSFCLGIVLHRYLIL